MRNLTLCVGRHKKQKSELPKQLAEIYPQKISSESAGTAKSPMTMHTATATAAIHHIDFCSVSSHPANNPFSKIPSSN
ncbi:hypothetical protein [Oribacterium sinus]